jgi:Capsule assembly protein Wzi
MSSSKKNSAMQYVHKSLCCLVLLFFSQAVPCHAISSTNIPLDSPIYLYLEKLSGFGLIASDIKGIRPFSKAEAARLVLEAELNLSARKEDAAPFAAELILRLRELIPREIQLRTNDGNSPKTFDYNLLSALRLRAVWLDGVPRDYLRQVHDPGGDGVFGIGSGLRPDNPVSVVATQRGSEGTPLSENNNGVIYRSGFNGELRWAADAYLTDMVSGLIEPDLRGDSGGIHVDLNRGYLKLGGGGLELEAGKDENWLGLGYRGAITLSSNATNFTLVKLSSPEPLDVAWIRRFLGEVKYSLVASRFERTTTDGIERQPWFYALKLSLKPLDDLEVGFNLGRQVGGPGVNNSFGDTMRGLIGGTGADNSNSLGGFEVRYRIPWLRNTELYGEFSGEDAAAFWPIVESYLAGFYIPRLTDDGRNDLRFEFFQGNQILYTNGTFPEGYLYKNLPIGHSQGGATQDFFFRYSHWFSVRNNLALEYFYTNRGMVSRVPGQAIERKHAGRVFWSLPLTDTFDARLGYGIERVSNLNLVDGAERTNQLMNIELRYRY